MGYKKLEIGTYSLIPAIRFALRDEMQRLPQNIRATLLLLTAAFILKLRQHIALVYCECINRGTLNFKKGITGNTTTDMASRRNRGFSAVLYIQA
jgi:hypothetical protein